ncbi:hypothetical protein ACW9UR_07095 [Halovulum sp. GXIMD14794]
MAVWNYEEVASIYSDDGESELVKEARVQAFLMRRRLGKRITESRKSKKISQIARKRFAKKKSRQLIVRAKRGLASEAILRNTHVDILLSKKKESFLLSGLKPNRDDAWRGIGTRIRTRKCRRIEVKNFSFLRHPVETVNSLAELAEAEADCLAANIDFGDFQCLDIGPWLVFAVMKPDMAPIFVGGQISNPMSKVVVALGLHKALSISVSPTWSGEKDIWAFPLQRRRAAGASLSPTMHLEPQSHEKVGDLLCEQISSWLTASADQELTSYGRRIVKIIVGETLDNAERHSRPDYPNDGDWMVSGMMVRRPNGLGETFHCQLAFLSVGSSISETISTCPPSIKARMEEYVKRHKRALASYRFSEEHLRTLFALQPEVTRDAEAFNEGRGGTGFSDIISLFADLAGIESGENDATLAVVSGRSCLHIRFPYCASDEANGHKARETWLNDINSPAEPPNLENVVELPREIRGTLVTMGFSLDRDYLERTINDPA